MYNMDIVLHMRHVSILCKHYYTYYYCVSSPFCTYVSFIAGAYMCVQKPRKHDDNYTTISPRAATTKTNKREFYFFYSSLSFYDLQFCAYRFFSHFFYSAFNFLFFVFIFFILRAAYGFARGIAGTLRV